jgi:hypothetical protein
MDSMETPKLWKIVVEARLDMHAIERAVSEVPDVTDVASVARGIELQRIDILEERSVVFATGSTESARALERCLQVAAPRAPVRHSEATARELYANEPPKG